MKMNHRNSAAFMLRPLPLRRPRGFTLVEMMLVLSIIAVLLGTAIFMMAGNVDSAKITRVQADITGITTQLKGYEMENGFMPTTEQGLKALVEEPTTEPRPKHWHSWFNNNKLPLDPWYQPYQYRNPGIHNPNGFDIWSYGQAKKENDKDIGNWDSDAKQ